MVDYFFLAFVLLVGVLQVNIDDLFDLATALLNVQEPLVDPVHHFRVKLVVLVPLERVLVQNTLGILPYALLDILHPIHCTVTRIRISWSR